MDMKRYIILLGCLLFSLIACNDEKIRENFIEQTNLPILTFLQNKPEYSEWSKLLERSGMAPAYGFSTVPMTFFIVKNNVVLKYLESKEMSSIDEMSPEEAKLLVQYHTIPMQEYPLNDFREGKLSAPTASADYLSCKLVFGAANEYDNGVFLNSYAKIIAWDLFAVNGVMHVLDHVLDPVSQTLFDFIDQNSEFKILKDAYMATELDTLLKELIRSEVVIQEPLKMRRTLLLTTDRVFKLNNINSWEELKAHLKAGDNLTDSENVLNQYLRYRILDRDYTTAQFASLLTSSPPNNIVDLDGVLISTMAKDKLLLLSADGLDYVFNKVEAVKLDVEQRNLQARNGFIQVVNGILEIEDPEPITVCIEPGDYYFLDQFPAYRHIYHSETVFELVQKDVENYMTWKSTPADKENAVVYHINSITDAQYYNLYRYRFGDSFLLKLGAVGEFKMKTMTIPKGKYNVVMNFRTIKAVGGMMQAYWNGEKVGDLLTGWEDGIDHRQEMSFGTMVFDTQKSHEFMLKVVSGGEFSWDAITFTPIN